MILAILMIMIVLHALWNGWVIKWGLATDKSKVTKTSKVWHAIGFIIRALLVLLIYLQTDWRIALLAAFLCWLPYNIIINACNGWAIFYFGKTSWIDRLINRLK